MSIQSRCSSPRPTRNPAHRATSSSSTINCTWCQAAMNPRNLPDERGNVWGVWNPALVGLPNKPENFLITQFIKDVYLDSQVNIALLSNVTASVINLDNQPRRPPRNVQEALSGEILTAAQTAAARNFVNEISGSTRMLAHGLLYVGKGNLEYIQQQIDQNKPDSWKGYNISNAAKVDNDPASPMRQWRHDDEIGRASCRERV